MTPPAPQHIGICSACGNLGELHSRPLCSRCNARSMDRGWRKPFLIGVAVVMAFLAGITLMGFIQGVLKF